MAIANEEIKNLALENGTLKNELTEITKKHNMMKKATVDLNCTITTPSKNSKLYRTTPVNKKLKTKTKSTQTQELTKTNDSQKQRNQAPSNNGTNRPATANTPSPTNTRNPQQTYSAKLKKALTGTSKLTDQKKAERQKKYKLCVISDRNRHILEYLENAFAEEYAICHYSKPQAPAQELLADLEKKVTNFTHDDFCIILLGQSEFKTTKNYNDLIQEIRHAVSKISHTNVIICPPTYVCGAPLFNHRVELFINMLNLDIETHKYAWSLDTNADLLLDMFSSNSGKLTKRGIRQIIESIEAYIRNGYEYDTQKSQNLTNNDQTFFRY